MADEIRVLAPRVILNPRAGRVRRYPCVVDDLLALPDAELRRTRGPGHAGELAAEAARQGRSAVVVAGGDGTVQEAVNGLVPPDGSVPDTAVALVPLGTGNDLARTLGVPLDPHHALEPLASGRIRRVDLVRARCGAGERHVVNFAIGGFAGDFADRVTPELRRRWGGLVYLRAALAGLPALRCYRTRLVVDGEALPPAELLAVVVANGRWLGHGIPAAPRAEVDDGRLDLVAIRGDVAARVPLTIARLLAGRHLDAPGVVWRRARHVEIRAEDAMPFNADGQPQGSGPATFRVLPGALRVVVPTGQNSRCRARTVGGPGGPVVGPTEKEDTVPRPDVRPAS